MDLPVPAALPDATGVAPPFPSLSCLLRRNTALQVRSHSRPYMTKGAGLGPRWTIRANPGLVPTVDALHGHVQTEG